MNPNTMTAAMPSYELRFRSLFQVGRALSFPCDHRGDVCIDRLGERARNNYFYARTFVGKEFACPDVRPASFN